MPNNEEREINTILKSLKKELDRNEDLMRRAAISYEDLVAEKESLLSTMEGLRKSRKEMRQRGLSRNDAVEVGSAPASGAVDRALAVHTNA